MRPVRMLLILVLLGCCSITAAQEVVSAKADSLVNIAEMEFGESARIGKLTELARRVANEDSALAMLLWDKTLKWSGRSRDTYSVAKTYLNISAWHYDHYRPNQAQTYIDSVLGIVGNDSSKNAKILQTRARLSLASIAWQYNDYDGAIKGYLEVLTLARELGDVETEALANLNIGILFANQGQSLKARGYILKSTELYKTLLPKSHQWVADNYIILSGNILEDKHASKDEGWAYLDSAHAHLKFIPKKDMLWANFFSTKGKYELSIENYKEAEFSFLLALPIARSYNDTYVSCDILLSLSEIYEHNGLIERIPPLLDEMLTLGQANHVGTFQLKALKSLARIEHRLHHPQAAFKYLNDYVELSDSLNNLEFSTTLRDMEEKYKLSEAQNKLLILQQENQQKDFVLERIRLYIILLAGVSIPLFICCILIFMLYRSKKKRLKQQQKIHQIDMEHSEQVHKNQLLSALLEGQEQERTRLARDLHDGLGGILSSVKMELSKIGEGFKQGSSVSKELYGVVHNVDGAVDELRGIAHSMMPGVLFEYGLSEALREYSEQLKRAGYPIFYQDVHFKNQMEKPRQLQLYRIVQEILNNCVKHAGANEILVQVQQVGNSVTLTVEDDGVGFDAALVYKGVGLRNIAMRVELLNGVLEIDSKQSVGTTITIECPAVQIPMEDN